MKFTKDLLWKLRKEIVLNSLYVSDYRNSFDIEPVVVAEFFDGFLDDMEDKMVEDIPGFDDSQFYDYMKRYDTPEKLWEYYYANGQELEKAYKRALEEAEYELVG